MRLIEIVAAFVIIAAEAVQDARRGKMAIYGVDELKRPVNRKIQTIQLVKDAVEVGRVVGRKGGWLVTAYK